MLLFLLLGAAFAMPSSARKHKEKKAEAPKITTIYIFGVAKELNDSVVYLSSITPVAGASLHKHNVLENRMYYSEQFRNYVENTYSLPHQTVAVFYSKKREKVEKKFAKVQAKMNRHSYRKPVFKNVSADDFHFKVPKIIMADDGEF